MMLTIDERAKKFDFRAWPTRESLPLIYERCRKLLTSGRSVTIIRHYVPEHPDQRVGLEVASGLRLDERSPIPVELTSDSLAFGFRFSRCEIFGVTCDDDHDELTAARRYHRGDRGTAEIAIFGVGEGVEDYIELTYRNEHGVVTVTRIQLEDRDAVYSDPTA